LAQVIQLNPRRQPKAAPQYDEKTRKTLQLLGVVEHLAKNTKRIVKDSGCASVPHQVGFIETILDQLKRL
jgi:hypothetical protein